VLDLTGTRTVDPVGVAWGLAAAACLSGYFVLSARRHDDLPPLLMAAGGTTVGALGIAVAGLVGVVPLEATTATTALAGTTVGWLVPTGWLVVVATVAAYLTGIGGVVRLGSRTASFVSLTEVLFAVLVAWVLLAELPGAAQLLGGAAILLGIVVIQRAEGGAPEHPPAPSVDAGRPLA
jgi:drug/metabolite transporter (DMT)-like permease